MDDVFILNESGTDAARSGLLRLHDTVGRREAGRPEATLSPDELLSRFRAADPTRNGACLPWLLRTYASEGYRLEDLSKAYDTLAAFARLRGQLPNTTTIDGETRNPRKLGSHVTLASLWSVIAPLVEAERLAKEDDAGERGDTDRERALAQSRVIHRSARMVMAVPMTEEASCWWGQGTQWCTAARNNNAFEHYHKDAPLIVVCLRKIGELPARKLQLYVHSGEIQFMDENDAEVSPEVILERWQDLEALLYWAVGRYGLALAHVPEPLRTEALCTVAVGSNGWALQYVPEHLRTEAIFLAAVGRNGQALKYVPEHLRTEAVCLAAVTQYGWALDCVPGPLCTETICIAAVGSNGGSLKYVPEHLRTEAICTIAVGEYGLALAYVPKCLRTEAICLAAVGRDGEALQYVPEPLHTEAMCLAAISRNGDALYYVPKPLRTEAICTVAVDMVGKALYYVPGPLRTEAICTIAVGRDVDALQYVPKHLRTEEMLLAAVGRDGLALKYVPEHLRTKLLCLTAVSSNGRALAYVPKPLRTEALAIIERHGQESVSGKTNMLESHDLALEVLEDYLNNQRNGHQETISSIKPG